MPTAWTRDLEGDGKKLLEWLRRKLPDATALEMTPLVQPGGIGILERDAALRARL